jgi:hypothetical protein
MFENPTVTFKVLRNSCVKIASVSSEPIFTFLYAGSSTQTRETAIRLVHSPFFFKLRPSSKPTNKNLAELGLAINTLNAKLNPICHLLALLGDHHILHVSRIRVKKILGNHSDRTKSIFTGTYNDHTITSQNIDLSP